MWLFVWIHSIFNCDMLEIRKILFININHNSFRSAVDPITNQFCCFCFSGRWWNDFCRCCRYSGFSYLFSGTVWLFSGCSSWRWCWLCRRKLQKYSFSIFYISLQKYLINQLTGMLTSWVLVLINPSWSKIDTWSV